jgi:hypothetical protein
MQQQNITSSTPQSSKLAQMLLDLKATERPELVDTPIAHRTSRELNVQKTSNDISPESRVRIII